MPTAGDTYEIADSARVTVASGMWAGHAQICNSWCHGPHAALAGLAGYPHLEGGRITEQDTRPIVVNARGS